MKKALIRIKEGLTLKVLFPNGDEFEYTNMVDWEEKDMIEAIMHIGVKCKENGWLIEFENIV